MQTGAWVRLTAILALACAGCDSSCEEVAQLLHQCCVRGPAALRAECEAEAERLEKDGNADACESALERGEYQKCEQ